MVEALTPASLADIAGFEREWAALVECVSQAHDVGRLQKLFPVLDWSRLLLLAEEHGVVGQLSACLNQCGGLGVPREFQQAILERQRAQNLLTLCLTAELFRILELFAAKDISVLVIKGPVLAVQAYGDPAMRSYGDLDLLVRQCDIRRATESLIASGYRGAVPLEAIDAGKIPGQYLFSRTDSNLLVELHNNLTLRYFPRPLPLEDFFQRQIRVRLDAHEVPAPSLEDELVLICIHGAKHFWERLSWIADVAGLVSRQARINWERAIACAKTVEAEHLLYTGLGLAAKVLGTTLPEPISARVRHDTIAENLATRALRWLPAAGHLPPGLLQRAAFRMCMRGGVFAGASYLLRLSFSPTEEDWQAGDKVSNNRFLDVLRRPFRLAQKYRRPRD